MVICNASDFWIKIEDKRVKTLFYVLYIIIIVIIMHVIYFAVGPKSYK